LPLISSVWVKKRAWLPRTSALQAGDLDFAASYETTQQTKWTKSNAAESGLAKTKAFFVGCKLG
jgi:hypothetical protein